MTKRDIVDIFKAEIVNKLDRRVTVKAVLNESQTQITVTFCDVKWMRKGMAITLVNNAQITFQVISVTNNDVVLQKPSALDTLLPREQLRLPEVKFFNGTRLVVNSEWKQAIMADVRSGVPLVWLHETVQERFLPREDAFERESELTIFLLDEVNELDLNADKRKDAVRTMYGLFSEIEETIERPTTFVERAGDVDVISFSVFGVEDAQGIRRKILDANLGGLEMRLSIRVQKPQCKC